MQPASAPSTNLPRRISSLMLAPVKPEVSVKNSFQPLRLIMDEHGQPHEPKLRISDFVEAMDKQQRTRRGKKPSQRVRRQLRASTAARPSPDSIFKVVPDFHISEDVQDIQFHSDAVPHALQNPVERFLVIFNFILMQFLTLFKIQIKRFLVSHQVLMVATFVSMMRKFLILIHSLFMMLSKFLIFILDPMERFALNKIMEAVVNTIVDVEKAQVSLVVFRQWQKA